MRSVASGTLATLLLGAGSGCIFDPGDAYHDDRHAYEPGPVSRFVARMDDTSTDFSVSGRGGEDAEVRARLGADDRSDLDAADISLEPHGSTVELLFDGDRFDVNLDFVDAHVPHGASLDLSTGSGDIEVDGMTGPVAADSGSGDLDVFTSGSVSLSTGSGDVRAAGATGDVYTGSGDVRYEVDPQASGTLRIRTGSGDVAVGIPRGLGVRVTADTGSGDVSIAAGGVHVENDGHVGVTLNGGGDLVLEIDSGSGDVQVRD